jgi:hypothetical protein
MATAKVKSGIKRAQMRWAHIGKNLVQAHIQEKKLSGQVLRVRTGRGRSTIFGKVLPTGDGFKIGTSVFYMIVWETTGLKRRTIVPVRKKALRFKIGGRVIFAKRAVIPRVPKKPYLVPGLKEMKPKLVALAKVEFQKVLKTMLPNRRVGA